MILRLAHVELGVHDLAAARAFYVDLLGFVEHAGDGDSVYLRCVEEFDLWSLKLTAGEPGLVHSGFRVSEQDDLTRLEQLHTRLGLPYERAPAGTEPGQGEALRVLTPEGHRVEFFHEFEEIDAYVNGGLVVPMRRGRAAGIPPSRIDHVSMRVPSVPAALEYWAHELDFSVSELWLEADDTPRVAWVRRSARSHDIALGRADSACFHHVAFAVADSAALVRAADLIGDRQLQARIEWGPSRHGATNALAMYVLDPAGNRVELYTGDYVRDLDRPPLLWRPEHYAKQGHSWWGTQAPDSFAITQKLVGSWVS
jgi:catechol 2,3-dioxygenase